MTIDARSDPKPNSDDPFQHPTRQCDLVMKGGVTSGIVYPPAVLALAERYRFRSIGGTSAGAIAAGATAAAEYARDRGGFARLRAHSTWLGQGRNLLDLFQPTLDTSGLLGSLLGVMEARRAGKLDVWAVSRIVRQHNPDAARRGRRRWGALVFGATLSAFLWLALLALGITWAVTAIGGWALDWSSTLAVILALELLLGLSAWLAGRWVGPLLEAPLDLLDVVTRRIPGNYYGMCRGLPEPTGHGAALTQWLSESLNDIAGLDPSGPPLTFRHLAEKSPLHGEQRGIDLRMVTTNLSHGRPYVLPLTTPAENTLFLFNEAELRDLFPGAVVSYMCTHAASTRVPMPDGYHYLPPGLDLPVIVGMRLSLSFPLLLSAVPLYTISFPALQRYRAARRDGTLDSFRLDPDRDLQRNWFSDGGIASNFPIHFFDDWLPSRPTFGIKLTSFPRRAFQGQDSDHPIGAEYVSAIAPEVELDTTAEPEMPDDVELMLEADSGSATDPVYLPAANRSLGPDWKPIETIVEFGHAVWTAAQNYHDNMQSDLPSYRDRVVQIRLADFEGGLNLGMSPETIAGMVAKGAAAGERLKTFEFDHHRWVRFLVLMAELEEMLHRLQADYDAVGYRQLLRAAPTRPDLPYRRNAAWTDEAIQRMDELLHLIDTWKVDDAEWQQAHPRWRDEPFFAHRAPQPEPVLRVTPDL
jgi:predicted acylesterase/phospholipase RssA